MKTTIALLLFHLCTIYSVAQMTIQVISTPQLTPLLDDLYITGNFNNWAPADSNYRLAMIDGVAQVDIPFTSNSNIEFKFTRGSWSTVEGNASGSYIENRILPYQNGETIAVTIEGWEDIPGNHTVSPHVRILDSDFYIPQLQRNRRIWVTLPTDYAEGTQHYPVVYMHDGQNLFDVATSFAGEWRVDETMNLPSMAGCKQAIFIGIDNGGMLRLNELSPWYNSEYDGGGEGDAYIDFIVETLKPFIDGYFRTLPQQEHTTITGSSLGGLISMYAIAQYPEIFGKAGIFSPAFWFNPEIMNFVETHPLPESAKIYFVCGTNESASMVGNMQQMRNLLLNQNIAEDHIGYLEVNGGQHNENFWANQFPAAHHFLAACTTTAIHEANPSQSLVVYPNPAEDSITISLPNRTITHLSIFDSQGRIVLQPSIPSAHSFSIQSLPPGHYILKIEYVTENNQRIISSHAFIKKQH